jgi:choline-sulfatase
MTDQQHGRMLGCAGNDYVRTPHLDRLAATGTRFERCYCANPVCVPSRFSLFTGRMPSEVGMWANSPARACITDEVKAAGLGHLIGAAGYRCLYAGKQHLPRMTAADIGFEVITEDEREGCAADCAGFLASGQDRPFFLVASFINPHDICYMAIRDFDESGGEAPLLKNGKSELETLDWALERPGGLDEATFFAEHCPPLPSNHPVQVREPEAVEATLLTQRPFRKKARERWSENRWREHRWAYKRLTEKVDAEIGTVLEALENGPNAADTVVIFTSDHGDHDASHKLEHKTVFYEEAAHVPLITRSPWQGRAGAVVPDRLVQNGVDLAPTLCTLAGVPVPAHLRGESFADVLLGQAAPPPRESVYLQNEIGEAVVTGPHKYVLCHEGADAEQLYDLERDPGETRDFAREPGYDAILAHCRGQLALWRERHGVTVPAQG